MRIIPNETPAPRLLQTAVAEAWRSSLPAPESESLQRGGFWSGTAFAILAGAALGAVLLCGATTLLITNYTAPFDESASPRLVPVTTPRPIAVTQPAPSASPEETATPSKTAPVVVEITPDLFRVSAISLGHPRVAVINHQQVAEGDWIEVATPAGRVGVKLHVIKIADGNVELTVGNHILTVPLQQLKLKPL